MLLNALIAIPFFIGSLLFVLLFWAAVCAGLWVAYNVVRDVWGGKNG